MTKRSESFDLERTWKNGNGWYAVTLARPDELKVHV